MIYFDNAATTFPKPPKVIEAVLNALTEVGANPGRGAYKTAREASEIVFKTRVIAAEFFGAEPENVVFTKNCTEALNIVLMSIGLEGGHFIISDLEHNSVLRPLFELEKRGIIGLFKINAPCQLRELKRLAKLLVSAQHDFLENGPTALHPLTQKEIADKMDIHETTVSRAIAHQYLQTPRGVIPFCDFFAGGYESEAGEDISVSGIKAIIREAVDQENPKSPLSDSKIESILKQRGYSVARRTIAKYREELGIPSSQRRKVYTA